MNPPAHASALLSGMNDEASLDHDLDVGLDALEAIGTRFVELRSVNRVVVDDLDEATFEETARRIEARGFVVVAWASDLAKVPPTPRAIEAECERLRRIAPRCHRVDCRLVRTMAFAPHFDDPDEQFERCRDGLTVMAELAASLDLRLALENAPNPKSIASRPCDVERLLDALFPTAMGLVFDPGNFAIAGHDPRDAIRRLLSRITHVHVKDCLRVGDWHSFCHPGDGIAGLRELLEALARIRYRGALTLEPHLEHRNGRHVSGFNGFVAAGRALRRCCGEAGVSLQTRPAVPGESTVANLQPSSKR